MKTKNQSVENFKSFLAFLKETFVLTTKSVFQDMKSWDTFKKNRWHLHILALPGIILFNFILWIFKLNNLGIGGNLAIQGVIALFVAFGFEWYQQRGKEKYLTKVQKFESNKDAIFTTYAAWLGLLVSVFMFSV